MDSPLASSPANQQHRQQSVQNAVVPSGGPQVRSRITVVCGECKRLKLKCDRKNPCGSCEKRDTVPRCLYSAAAAEKVDLHSLNNRVTALESHMAQCNSNAASHPHPHHHSGGPGQPPQDRALIAVGHSGSSLIIPSEDVTGIWLNQLGLDHELLPVLAASDPSAAGSDVKQEPTSMALPDESSSGGQPAVLHLPPPSTYFTSSPSQRQAPSVSPELVHVLLPPSPKRRRLCNNVEDILAINPSFYWKPFKDRMDVFFKWAEQTGATASRSPMPSKADAARAILFNNPAASSQATPAPQPTVSLFAAVAAAFALGAQASASRSGLSSNDRTDDVTFSGRPLKKLSGPSGVGKKAKTATGAVIPAVPEAKTPATNMSPAALFALSEQALDLFEKSNTYDVDYLIAMILRALYMLHDGQPVIDHRLYPLVGKMANIARMMGLAVDPDEFPGKYSLFEAETRRRIWWDVYCYDLYVSDCMGHPPSIMDNSFTTKLPLDMDESLFGPSSSTIPVPADDNHGSRYFGHKIRLAQLVKSVKKRSFRDPLVDNQSESSSIDEAFSFHAEVKHFLSELPPAFQLDANSNISTIAASPAVSSECSTLIAQQCELAVTAQRLVLKIYLPFLRSPNVGSSSHNQATVNTVNAAHGIVHASRVLHAIYKQSQGDDIRRPGPAIFEYYSFCQALFSAAVVCAHSVISEPTAIWAKEALNNVNGSLEVMRDPMVATGRAAIHRGGVSESVRIVEILKQKAEAAMAGSASTSGSKRKYSEVEGDVFEMPAGFQLPYAGPAVASSGSASSVNNTSPTSSSQAYRDESVAPPRQETPASELRPSVSPEAGDHRRLSSGDKSKNKEKKLKLPPHGVRKRAPEEGPPYMRDKLVSDTSTSSFPEVEARAGMHSGAAVSHPPTPVPTSHYSYPMTEQDIPAYHQPLSADLMPPPSSEYQPTFSTVPPTRRFNADHNHHQGYPPANVYDQNQGNSFQGASSSPTSYGTPSSGQSPANSAFGNGSNQSYIPLPNYYPHSSYPPSYDNGNQSSIVGIPLEGLGGPAHASYDDVKPHNINTATHQSFDQGHGWEQAHGSDIHNAGQQFYESYYTT